MSNLSNSQNSKPSQRSSSVDWEIIRSYEYDQNSLLRTSLLYVLRLCDQSVDYSLEEAINAELHDTILFRVNVIKNKSPELEVLKGIFPYKFDVKNKEHSSLLRSVSRYFSSNVGIKLPEEVKSSFTKEYKEAMNMLSN